MSTDIGQKIRDLRKLEKLSQQNLADLIGTTKGTIYKWERGENSPTTSTLRRLTDHPRFKKYAAWLLTDERTVQEAPAHFLADKFEQLSEADQQAILNYMDFLLSKDDAKAE